MFSMGALKRVQRESDVLYTMSIRKALLVLIHESTAMNIIIDQRAVTGSTKQASTDMRSV